MIKKHETNKNSDEKNGNASKELAALISQLRKLCYKRITKSQMRN